MACVIDVAFGQNQHSSSSSSAFSSSDSKSYGWVAVLVLLLLLLVAGCLCFYFFLWKTGKFQRFMAGFSRGHRSASVRYSTLTASNDWLEDDDDDDMLGGDVVSGAAPVVVVQDAASGSSTAPKAAAPATDSAGAKDIHQGAPGSWEIKWDEDLEDDGGIGAWGTLPVTKPAGTGAPAGAEKPVGSNPFEDDDAF